MKYFHRMFVINIIVLVITGGLAVVQAFKDYKIDQDITLLKILIVCTIVGLGLSITSELLKRKNELVDAKDREDKHIALLSRADSTLSEVKTVLDTSNRVLSNTDASLKQLNDLQNTSNKLNDSLAKQLKIQAETNEDTKNLLVKSNEATNLLIQNLNEQTGGNSFCYIQVNLYPDYNQDRANLVTSHNFETKLIWREMIILRNDGNFSLRNVHIEIQKPYIASQHLRNNLPIYDWIASPLKNDYFIAKHSKTIIYEGLLPDTLTAKDEIIYDAKFFLGNGNQYTQVVKLAKAHGGWPEATKIIETTDTAYKYEYVHPLYPKQPVNWNYLRPLSNTFRQ